MRWSGFDLAYSSLSASGSSDWLRNRSVRGVSTRPGQTQFALIRRGASSSASDRVSCRRAALEAQYAAALARGRIEFVEPMFTIAASVAQQRDRRATDPKHPVDIDTERLAPDLIRRLRDRGFGGVVNTGVVREDVESAEAVGCLGERMLDRRPVGLVEHEHDRRARGLRLDHGCGLGDVGGRPRRHDHVAPSRASRSATARPIPIRPR